MKEQELRDRFEEFAGPKLAETRRKLEGYELQDSIVEMVKQVSWASYLAASTPLLESELKLRRLLAYARSGSLLYSDDGELQDNSRMPFIDYLRDSPDEIDAKLTKRAMDDYTALQHKEQTDG